LDVDVEDVLSAAATKWNFHRYTPGVGVGGHCIPVDPYYMIQRASDVGVSAGLISAARNVNRSMPAHVAGVIFDILQDSNVVVHDAKVLLLGWSYKAGVGDPRQTPAKPLAETLMSKGIKVAVWDPYIEADFLSEGVELMTCLSNPNQFDMVVLVTAHRACLEIDWSSLQSNMRTPLVYDGRRVLNLNDLDAMGWKSYAVGKPLGS
jgi:nucleotide sugar dehydrogenase